MGGKPKAKDYSDENVQLLVNMGVPPQDAIDSLKAQKDQINEAANYYFNGQLDIDRAQKKKDSQWDATAFAAQEPASGWDASDDSDGIPWQNNAPQYTIQGPDVQATGVGPARSRAPSPVGFDSSENRYAATAPLHTPVSEADEDLKKALEMSMQDQNDGTDGINGSMGYGPQMSGVTGTRSSPVGSKFGPATKEHYDMSQWSMVHTAQQQPPGSYARQRLPGNPVFLRPNKQKNYLPGLLTALHSIPVSRNALLALEYGVLEDYGWEPTFWNGGEIEIPRPGGGVLEDPNARIVYEVQRIVAFLDDTTRAYGSCDSLPRPFMEPSKEDALTSFAEGWKNALMAAKIQGAKLDSVESLFTEVIKSDEMGQEKNEFFIMRVGMTDVNGTELPSLYAALNELIIDESPEVDNYFSRVGDVLCLQLDWPQNHVSPKVDLPDRFFTARWTEEYLDKIREIKVQKVAIGETISTLQEQMEKVTKVSKDSWSTYAYDGVPLLKAIVAEYERKAATGSSKDAKKAVAITDIISRIEAKAEELRNEIDNLYAKYLSSQSAYTTPKEGLPEDTNAHYLSAVITDPYTTYLAVDFTTQNWHRITFSPPPINQWAACISESYMITTVSLEEVLQAARESNESSLVAVYATQGAFQPSNLELPKGLRDFVQRDNDAFKDELDAPAVTDTPPSPPQSISSTSDSLAPNVLSPRPQRYLGLVTPQESTGTPEPEAQLHRELEARNPDQMDVDSIPWAIPDNEFSRPSQNLSNNTNGWYVD